jgi:hypothetical protein
MGAARAAGSDEREHHHAGARGAAFRRAVQRGRKNRVAMAHALVTNGGRNGFLEKSAGL